jgi:hypothetical protein
MKFEILFTEHADDQLIEIELSKDKKTITKTIHRILTLTTAGQAGTAWLPSYCCSLCFKLGHRRPFILS